MKRVIVQSRGRTATESLVGGAARAASPVAGARKVPPVRPASVPKPLYPRVATQAVAVAAWFAQYDDTMRTPPPVLPPGSDDSPEYKRSWFDTAGPDAGLRLKAAAYGAMTGALTFACLMLIAAQGGSSPRAGGLFVFLLIGILVGWLTTYLTNKISDGAGAVAKSFTLPSGNSTPYEQTFSYQEALAIRGDMAGALESYEAIISENPTAIPPRMKAAEHYATKNRNPARAAELFREIRSMEGVSSRDSIYASSRLVDLYEGPLADPGRALVELRRIIELHPNSSLATHARTALPRLKAQLEESRNN